MCVIIITPGTLPTRVQTEFEEILRHSDRINPDGGGVINRNTGQVKLWESHRTHDMKKYIMDNINDPLAIHYRKSTAGSKTGTDNLHPFNVPDTPWWVMMNGTHKGLGYNTKSDTREFAEELLAKVPCGPGWAAMARMCNPARIAYINAETGEYHLHNRGSKEQHNKGEGWFKRHGIWYSKTNVFPENNKNTTTPTQGRTVGYNPQSYAGTTAAKNKGYTGGSSVSTPGKHQAATNQTTGSGSKLPTQSQAKTTQSGYQSTKVKWLPSKVNATTESLNNQLRRASCNPEDYPTLTDAIIDECIHLQEGTLRVAMLDYLDLKDKDLPIGVSNGRLLHTCLEQGWEYDFTHQQEPDAIINSDMYEEALECVAEMQSRNVYPIDLIPDKPAASAIVEVPFQQGLAASRGFHPYGDGPRFLAVYGTLRVGKSNWARLIKPWVDTPSSGVDYMGQGTTRNPYRMAGSGVPYVFKGQGRPKGSKQIVVDVFQIDNEEVARRIDMLEGHPNNYRREIIPVTYRDADSHNHHTVEAWLYFAQGEPWEGAEFYSDFVVRELELHDQMLKR